MLGAIIGDIVGSIYEWDRIKTKNFPFFALHCDFTDDTVCTVAVADILLNKPSFHPRRQCRSGVVAIPGAATVDCLENGFIPMNPHPTEVTETVQRCASHRRRS